MAVDSSPAQQQAPPFGQTAAVQPSPNRGFEAAGVQKLGMIVKSLEQMVPMFGAGSEVGEAVLKALNILAKHIKPGAQSPAAERGNIEQMAMRNAQENQIMQQLRQQQMQRAQQPQQSQQAAA